MPLPNAPRVFYRTNPLEVVICQLRFSPILLISEEGAGKFQDAIRESFPGYEKVGSGGISLPDELPLPFRQLFNGGLAPPEHRFLAPGGKQFLVLHQNFLALSDTSYTRWERFTELLSRGREVLLDVYKPGTYTRVGLRYVDLISRGMFDLKDEPWDTLIQPLMLGPKTDPEIGDALTQHQGKFIARVDEVDDALVSLTYGPENVQSVNGEAEEKFRIDIDIHVSGSITDEDVSRVLDEFHTRARGMFRWAITDRLHSAMGPGSPE